MLRLSLARICLPNLNSLGSLIVLLDVDVDGKVSVDISHLVLVASGHTGDQVVDDRLDGSEGSDILAGAVVDFDLDCLLALDLGLGEGKCYGDVGEILRQFSYSADMSVCFIPNGLCPSLMVMVVLFVLYVAGCRTSWTLDCNDSRSDVDFDIVRYGDQLFGEDVLHLEQQDNVCVEGGCSIMSSQMLTSKD